jgi:hypothetical protein
MNEQPVRPFRPTPSRRLRSLQKALVDSELRISQRGVPHVVYQTGGRVVSICWFGRDQKFRVFDPYPSDNPRKKDFYGNEFTTLVKWLKDGAKWGEPLPPIALE